MPVYCTQQDVEDYIESWVTVDPAKLERELDRAELDIDRLMYRPPQLYNGRRLDVSQLADDELDALKRAVCAQFEYRQLMGYEFFAKAQWQTVSGPDFNTTGRQPYIGPKVWRELSGTFSWRQLGARARPGRYRRGTGGFFTPGSLPWPLGLGGNGLRGGYY
jgi:hypothetical protein